MKMLLKDLQDMLDGMKLKLYYKTFKKLNQWDENFLKFVQSSVHHCLKRLDEILVQSSVNFNSKAAFDEYRNIRDSLSLSLKDVNLCEIVSIS